MDLEKIKKVVEDIDDDKVKRMMELINRTYDDGNKTIQEGTVKLHQTLEGDYKVGVGFVGGIGGKDARALWKANQKIELVTLEKDLLMMIVSVMDILAELGAVVELVKELGGTFRRMEEIGGADKYIRGVNEDGSVAFSRSIYHLQDVLEEKLAFMQAVHTILELGQKMGHVGVKKEVEKEVLEFLKTFTKIITKPAPYAL